MDGSRAGEGAYLGSGSVRDGEKREVVVLVDRVGDDAAGRRRGGERRGRREINAGKPNR